MSKGSVRGLVASLIVMAAVFVGRAADYAVTVPEGSVVWSDIAPEGVVDTTTELTLTLSGTSTITLGTQVAVGKLVVKGTGDLYLADPISLYVQGAIDKSALQGSLGMIFDYARDKEVAGLDEIIKANVLGTDYKLVFRGTGETGFTIDLGTQVNAALPSHLIFEGGRHVFKYGRDVSGDFGTGATDANPTLRVMTGTTVDLYGGFLTGWNGTYNANGVIRVDDGATLNVDSYGGNAAYYRQRLVLESGATVNVPETNAFRLYGGAANDTITVLPAPDGTAKAAVINGWLNMYNDGTPGFGINVQEGARLVLSGCVRSSVWNAADAQYAESFAKRGKGVLEGLAFEGYAVITELENVAEISVRSRATTLACTVVDEAGAGLVKKGGATLMVATDANLEALASLTLADGTLVLPDGVGVAASEVVRNPASGKVVEESYADGVTTLSVVTAPTGPTAAELADQLTLMSQGLLARVLAGETTYNHATSYAGYAYAVVGATSLEALSSAEPAEGDWVPGTGSIIALTIPELNGGLPIETSPQAFFKVVAKEQK